MRGLFEADLSELSGKETLCLREIARLAPAEWVQIVEQFGNDTYSSLLDKRLIVRSGDRLNPYWDIFGDYLRTNEIPHVPVSFLPGTEIRTLARAGVITIVNRPDGVTLGKLSTLLSISNRSAGNVIRDLQMFGLAERTGDRIVSTIDINERKDAVAAITRLITTPLGNHVFTVVLRRSVARGSALTEQDLLGFFEEAFRYASLRDVTKRVYVRRLAQYLTATRFLERVPGGWILIDEPAEELILMPRVRGAGEFLGDAPPERVVEVLQKLSKYPVPRADLNKSHLRNATACAIMLGLASTRGGIVSRVRDTEDIEASLVGAVTNTRALRMVSELIFRHPNMSATEIGKALSEHLDLPWSEASNIRRGNSLRRWVRWSQSRASKRSEPV